MSSVLVVVIVGVIIVVVTAATVRGGPQPPTPGEPPQREPVPWGASSPAHLTHDLPVDEPVDEPRALERTRSAFLLGVLVVVMGSLAAGLLGTVVFLGAHAVNKALG